MCITGLSRNANRCLSVTKLRPTQILGLASTIGRMQYRPLGTTGIRISAISFGAGPVPALLTRDDAATEQLATVRAALEAGINWFDTAPTYGKGPSKSSLGTAPPNPPPPPPP